MTTKEQVLTLLEQNRGGSVSGAALAGRLGLSRNAVWKAVQELRRQGYDIASGTNRGYALAQTCDVLSAEGIRACLGSAVKDVPIHVYPELESTNKTAKMFALDGAPHGTAVLCDRQTAGKGRFGRGFSSPPGGVYMSVVLDAAMLGGDRPFDPAHVTIAAAVAVCGAVEALTGSSPGVKWVNDVLLGRKKICGISTEGIADFESGQVAWVVLGIGVNLFTRAEDFAPEHRDVATSLYPDGKSPVTRARLAAEILSNVLNRAPWEETLAAYRQRLCMLGETVTVRRGHETFPAVALDVDSDGRLVVRKEDGAVLSLSSGEISIRLPPPR